MTHWPLQPAGFPLAKSGLCGAPLLAIGSSTEKIEDLDCTDCAFRVLAQLRHDESILLAKIASAFVLMRDATEKAVKRD